MLVDGLLCRCLALPSTLTSLASLTSLGAPLLPCVVVSCCVDSSTTADCFAVFIFSFLMISRTALSWLTRHSMSSPTALAACPLAHPVQTVLQYAFSFKRKVRGVFIRHRSDSECQQTASSPTIILIDRLRATTTSHKVRRARLFSHWSVCMEQTTRRHSRGT